MKILLIEVISGCEGPCLYLVQPSTGSGYRIAGPKPRGGGHTIYSFKVDLDDLIREAKAHAEQATAAGAAGEVEVPR